MTEFRFVIKEVDEEDGVRVIRDVKLYEVGLPAEMVARLFGVPTPTPTVKSIPAPPEGRPDTTAIS